MHIIDSDISAEKLHKLELQCFPKECWSLATIESDLCSSLYMVCELDGCYIGYVCASFFDGEAELNRICVHPEFRGQGVGRLLINSLISRLRDNLCTDVFLEVRSKNSAAISLYDSVGFDVISNRKKYYHNPDDDAVVMHIDI